MKRPRDDIANCLFDAQRLDVDCKFLELSDAEDFMKNFVGCSHAVW